MMAGIRGKNTRPEMLLRKGLHALGWRYRLQRPWRRRAEVRAPDRAIENILAQLIIQ